MNNSSTGNRNDGISRADRLTQSADGIIDGMSEKGAELGRKAEQAARSMAHKAADFTGSAESRTDDVIASVGGGLNHLADSVRDRAPASMASAASCVADTLQSGGNYLTHRGVSGMADDVTGMVRKHPMQSLWIGIGIGVLLGNALTRK